MVMRLRRDYRYTVHGRSAKRRRWKIFIQCVQKLLSKPPVRQLPVGVWSSYSRGLIDPMSTSKAVNMSVYLFRAIFGGWTPEMAWDLFKVSDKYRFYGCPIEVVSKNKVNSFSTCSLHAEQLQLALFKAELQNCAANHENIQILSPNIKRMFEFGDLHLQRLYWGQSMFLAVSQG